MQDLYQTLLQQAEQLPVLDTHTHIPTGAAAYAGDDILSDYLRQYVHEDLVSAGLCREALARVLDPRGDLAERWSLVEPYWRRCSFTGYGRAVRITLQKLYGVPDFTAENLLELNRRYREGADRRDWRVLREHCNIECAISDYSLNAGIEMPGDHRLFRPVFRLDHLIFPKDVADLERINRECGFRVHSFEDLLEATRVIMDRALANGAVGFKNGIAYSRSLHYGFARLEEARASFDDIRLSRIGLPDGKEHHFVLSKAFQDFMMHYILSIADRMGAVYQFHTGIHAGNGNRLGDSNPLLLENLFTEYPGVRFDVFHMGYPFYLELGVLAKQFPNVYADLCWAHIVSPKGAREALDHWLDTVPTNKILGFGDDYNAPDVVIGHLAIARENICRVLAGKVAEGYMDLEAAGDILERLLYSNAKELFEPAGERTADRL